MAVTIGYLGSHDSEVWLDDTLGSEGDFGGILTIDSETMGVLSGHGTKKFVVSRGDDGVPHAIGSTVTLSGVLEVTANSPAASAIQFKVSTVQAGYDYLIDATDAVMKATSNKVVLMKFTDSAGTVRYLEVSSGGTVTAGTAI